LTLLDITSCQLPRLDDWLEKEEGKGKKDKKMDKKGKKY